MFTKAAYRVRWANESIRFMLHRRERGILEAGYSPFVIGARESYTPGEQDAYELSGIYWTETLRAAFALFEGDDAPPIRVPSFVLRGVRVLPTRTLLPAEYERGWRRNGLDHYLHAWSELRGQRCCLACLNALPAQARSSKRFCSERCRNAEKQRRFRQRNPEAADLSRKRYQQSLAENE